MKILLYALLFGVGSTVNAAELVKSCILGADSSQRVSIIRDSKIASTYVYSLQQQGVRTPLFGTPEQSRGDSVKAECVGHRQRALIVSGEFTANALQGFVIAYPPSAAAPERLDFAEKMRPGWLYLGPHEIKVVFANSRYGESNANYVMYRHIFGKSDDDQSVPLEELPSPSGELIRLKQQN